MGRKRDFSEPNHTCPIIDNTIDCLQHCDSLSESDRDYIADCLEKVRKANAELRSWGSGLYDDLLNERERADAAEQELKDAKDKIDDLRSENKRLIKELESAESKIERMETTNG